MKRLPAHVDSNCSIGEIVRQVSGSIRICCYKDPAEVLKKCGKIESVESRFCGPVKEPDGRKKRGRAVKIRTAAAVHGNSIASRGLGIGKRPVFRSKLGENFAVWISGGAGR